jgi:hypothetical protein
MKEKRLIFIQTYTRRFYQSWRVATKYEALIEQASGKLISLKLEFGSEK